MAINPWNGAVGRAVVRRPGASILIIDDSKTMVAALARMLHENQFTILETFDGESGLELLRKNKPSLIFLDIIRA